MLPLRKCRSVSSKKEKLKGLVHCLLLMRTELEDSVSACSANMYVTYSSMPSFFAFIHFNIDSYTMGKHEMQCTGK